MTKRFASAIFITLCVFATPLLCFAGGKTEKTETQEKVIRVMTSGIRF